jgi:hypothetical protein
MLSWYYKIKPSKTAAAQLNRTTVLQIGDDANVTIIVKELSAEGTTLAEITHSMNREDLLYLYNAIGRRVHELYSDDHELRRHVDGTLFAFDSSGRAKGLG